MVTPPWEDATMRKVPVLAAIAALIAFSPANSATTVLGNGLAGICSQAAIAGSDEPEALQICTLALETESMNRRDRAGTFVNRGVLKMRRQDYREARGDFETAARLQPTMGEAFVNRGAALVGEKRYLEALLDIDRGLALAPEEPEKAYYNRGLANEGLDDLKAAYFDYLRAVELKPEWDIPKRELTRFKVVKP
jgi:tetratricopeptide (TPR) repeat protein